MDVSIRLAREEDAKELLNIYAYYVENTAVSFEQEVPNLEEFTDRVKETLHNYPYLVAIVDDKIVGYIYAGKFRHRVSYRWSASTSIYIDKQFHRMGLGKLLYAELEKILVEQNIMNVYAVVADPLEEDSYLTHNSEHFHDAIGYKVVARYHKCASKFGKWYNTIEMEKVIGEHKEPPREFVPFEDLKKDFSRYSRMNDLNITVKPKEFEDVREIQGKYSVYPIIKTPQY